MRVRRESVSLQQTAASLDVYCVLLGGGRDGNNVATEIRNCYTVTAITLNRIPQVNVTINQSKADSRDAQAGFGCVFLISFCLGVLYHIKINVKQVRKLAKRVHCD